MVSWYCCFRQSGSVFNCAVFICSTMFRSLIFIYISSGDSSSIDIFSSSMFSICRLMLLPPFCSLFVYVSVTLLLCCTPVVYHNCRGPHNVALL